MSGFGYSDWSYDPFEKMVIFPPDPLLVSLPVRYLAKLQYRYCYRETLKHYRYGKFSDYNTGNAIRTLFTITSTVIGKITIPVMLS